MTGENWLVSLTFPACLRTLFIHYWLSSSVFFCIPEGWWYFPDRVWLLNCQLQLELYKIFPLTCICSKSIDLALAFFKSELSRRLNYTSGNSIFKLCITDFWVECGSLQWIGVVGWAAWQSSRGRIWHCHFSQMVWRLPSQKKKKKAGISIGWSLSILWRGKEGV